MSLNYYYCTTKKYSKLLSKEIDVLYKLYTDTNTIRSCDIDTLKYTIENLVYNCVRCSKVDTDELVYTRREEFYGLPIIINGRKKTNKVSYSLLLKLLNVLEQNEYVKLINGGNFKYVELIDSDGELHKICDGRESSIITILPKLLELIETKSVDNTMVNVLILRDKEKKPMCFKKTPLNEEKVDLLMNYNWFLDEHKFVDGKGKVIAEPFLKRIFNLTFDRGGRFYTNNGVIQNLPKSERSKIKVDGKSVVEIDAVALHPSILATKNNCVVDYDPYDFTVPATIDDKAIEDFKIKYNKPDYNPLRALCKICLLVAFNTDTRAGAISAISNKFREDSKLPESLRKFYGLSDINYKELYNNMETRNIAIAEYFGSSSGAYLQFLDSSWMERVLWFAIQEDIPAIPIHDSVLVPVDSVDTMIYYMTLAYKQSFGDTTNFKVTVK